jgi:hypothetical protein
MGSDIGGKAEVFLTLSMGWEREDLDCICTYLYTDDVIWMI